MLQAALNGSRDRSEHPALPVTPEHIAWEGTALMRPPGRCSNTPTSVATTPAPAWKHAEAAGRHACRRQRGDRKRGFAAEPGSDSVGRSGKYY
jgi:hypothetical protein